MELIQRIWGQLGVPIEWTVSALGVRAPDIVYTLGRVAILAVCLLVLITTIRSMVRSIVRVFRTERLVPLDDVYALHTHQVAVETGQRQPEAGPPSEGSVALLRKMRRYDQLAETYLAAAQPREAAKWFMKAGDQKRASEALAQSGRYAKAAKMMMRAGEYGLAAAYYTQKGDHRSAAKAYRMHNDLSAAAVALSKARRHLEAIETYREYFANTMDRPERQIEAADQCLGLLDQPKVSAKVPAETLTALHTAIASRYEGAERLTEAAALFTRAGDYARAGEAYLRNGELQKAADCMRRAGREDDHARLMGRYHSQRQEWMPAAEAYLRAKAFDHAGECLARAGRPLEAADSYMRAGQFYRAGLAYAQAGRFPDAVSALQRVPETDGAFDRSRSLLGRCYYEMHDFPRCAATLQNHLLGQRVERANLELFYMLALALEQLGRLEESQEILYRINSVSSSFRDVEARISSISSRIAMAADSGVPGPVQSPASERETVQVDQARDVERRLSGRYRIEREIGRGGMGVVYLARDVQLDRPVALKFMGDRLSSSAELRQRFLREARAAARITHPNIVGIYDVAATEDSSYIAMEYVDGPSLYHYVRQRDRLPAREAANIVTQACSALEAIHHAGVVHRDIKPENILVGPGGIVKLMDFGLAKTQDARMTRSGVSMGTPAYMAPEQVLGKEATVESDIYALGLVLHECLTGDAWFAHGDTLDRQLHEMPDPPSRVVAGVPADLDAVVLRCLAKQPEERYRSASELSRALRAV